MNASVTINTFAIGLLSCACFLGAANAKEEVSIEKLAFKLADAFESGAAVSGDLRLPDSKLERLPAVLILHSSPGFDGRGAFYAEALNEAGIATVEIDYLQGKGLPATPRHNLPHAYETLRYLAGHPRIDPTRIGIMGFSWGGVISLLTSSDELTRQHTGGTLRFAAHLGLYPICWMHREILAGTSRYFKPTIYQRVTGSPVQILVGENDGSDNPGSCQKLLAALPDGARSHFHLTVYPGATFAWDSRFSSTSYFVGANEGKGGFVNQIADPDIANRSREFAVSYFKKSLGAIRW